MFINIAELQIIAPLITPIGILSQIIVLERSVVARAKLAKVTPASFTKIPKDARGA